MTNNARFYNDFGNKGDFGDKAALHKVMKTQEIVQDVSGGRKDRQAPLKHYTSPKLFFAHSLLVPGKLETLRSLRSKKGLD